MNIEQEIMDKGLLEIVHANMAELSKTDKTMFAMARRVGLGASDASVILGVNQWTTLEDLIASKRTTTISEEEIAIGEKEVVRKGSDLEPIILQKFADKFNVEVCKPKPMYRIIEHPQLTINYDGVISLAGTLIPVEAKFCSMYANKYWDRARTIENLQDGPNYIIGGGMDIAQHITETARLYGIPPYYYTQVQQQMMGLHAPFAYFATIFDKGWEFGAYKIYADNVVQNALKVQSAHVWATVKRV